MPQALVHSNITCPYCFSDISIEIDVPGGDQDYYEDCQVCCAPVALSISIDHEGEVAGVEVQPGN